MKKYTLNEEGAVMGGMDAPVPVKLPYVAEPVRSGGGVINNITYNIDNSQRTWNGGSFVKDGLGWFKTNWKAIAIAAGTAALVAGLIALISKLTKSIKLRYNKCVRTLARAQHDFTLEEKGLDMKAIMPGVGSALADKLSYLFTRIGRGKSSRSTNANNNIGLYPFCNKFISETNDDYTTAVSAFNKIKLASDESSEGGNSSESFNGKVYGSFREAIMSDYITESADGKQHVDESVLAMASAGISLASMAVKAGKFILSRKNKEGKSEEKAVQVTKESTREICYAIMLNYLDKYINVEQVFKQIGINTASLSDIDKSSCDKLAMMLKKYSKPEPNVVTKQYNRVKAAYDGMLKHYYNIGYGIIGNFKKYTEAKDEKHENLLVSANEKLTNMWDSQKDTYDNNFSHVIIEITSSEPYQNYLNFIVEKVIPVFKSGIAGDADYVLDTYPRRGEMYVVRQSLAQDNLPDGKPVELKGKAAIVIVDAFDLQKKEITFSFVGGIEEGGYSVDDHGIAKVEMSKLDRDAYKTDDEKQRQHKLPYPKWLALDPCLTTESSIRINEIGSGETETDGKTNNFYVFDSNAESVLNVNANVSLTQITNIVLIIGDSLTPKNIFNIQLKEPKTSEEIKKLFDENSEKLKLAAPDQKALPMQKNEIAGYLMPGKSSAVEASYEEVPTIVDKILKGDIDAKSSEEFSTIYSRENDNGKEYLYAIGIRKKKEGEENKTENPTDKAMSMVENPKNRQEREQNDNLESGNGGNADVNSSVKYEFSNELNESLKKLNSLYSNALFEDGEESNNLVDDTKKEESNNSQITADGENGNEKMFTTIIYVVENKEGKRTGYKFNVDAEFSVAEFAEKVKAFKTPFTEANDQEKLLKEFINGSDKWGDAGNTKLDSIEEDIDKVDKGGEEDDIDVKDDGKSGEVKTITAIYTKTYQSEDNSKKYPMFAFGFSNVNVESVNNIDRQHLNDDINESINYAINEGLKDNIKSVVDKLKDKGINTWQAIKKWFKEHAANKTKKGISIADAMKHAFDDWGDVFKEAGVDDYNPSDDKEPEFNFDSDDNKDDNGKYNVIKPDDENAKESKVSGIMVAKNVDGEYVSIKYILTNESTVDAINTALTDNGFEHSDRYDDNAELLEHLVDKVQSSAKNEEKINLEAFGEALKKFENGEDGDSDSNVNYDEVSKKIFDVVNKIDGIDNKDNYELTPSLGEDGNTANGPSVYALKSDKCPDGKRPISVSMGVETKDGKDIFTLVLPVLTHDDNGNIEEHSEPNIVLYVMGKDNKAYRLSSNIDENSIKESIEKLVNAAKNGEKIEDGLFDTNIATDKGGDNSDEAKSKIEADIKTLSGMIEYKQGSTSADIRNAEEKKDNPNVSTEESIKYSFLNSINESSSPELVALKQAYRLSNALNEDDTQSNAGGWVLKSGKTSEENGNVIVEVNNGTLKVTFTDVYFTIGGTEDFFSFYLSHDATDNKNYVMSCADDKVKSNGVDNVDGGAMLNMCSEIVEGLKKSHNDFKFSDGKSGNLKKPQITQQPAKDASGNQQPAQQPNKGNGSNGVENRDKAAPNSYTSGGEEYSSLQIEYDVNDVVFESSESNINVSRYINKQGKGWYVLSESYYDDGYGYTSKLENSSYRNRLKTRDDFTTFAKSFVNAKFAKLEPEMNFTVVSNQSYKPSIITPLCECIVVVKFDKNDNVMYKHYLGKRIISK